ncbi:unnamed protein product [Effrenium voratum]|nr:unnamed protein product [Effrenium voratum]
MVKGQLDAWNKSMSKTYDLYIPGPYESFAQDATEERTESGGNSVGSGTESEGQGGGGSHSEGTQEQSGGGGSGGSAGQDSGYQPGGGKKTASGEVGYESFAKPWVIEYATEEGGRNAFDYEGKEFASGGMQMGGVQDYAEYMEQYAGQWVPDQASALSHQSSHDAHEHDAHEHNARDAHDERDGHDAHNAHEDKSHEADDAKDDDDSHEAHDENGHNHGFPEASAQEAHHEKGSHTPKHVRGSKHGHAHGDALHDGKASKGDEAPAPALLAEEPMKAHPMQPVRFSWDPKAEALASARRSVRELQQAAQDPAYASWTLSKRGKLVPASRAEKLRKAMEDIRLLTRRPLDAQSLQELEDASRAASGAITRLEEAETQQLRLRAQAASKAMRQGAAEWTARVREAAQDPELREQASRAGAELQKSLTAALTTQTQKSMQELLAHAEQRRGLLRGVVEAVDVGPQASSEELKEASLEVGQASQALARPPMAEQLKVVSGSWLLLLVTGSGLLCCAAGFLRRVDGASKQRESKEIALLNLA